MKPLNESLDEAEYLTFVSSPPSRTKDFCTLILSKAIFHLFAALLSVDLGGEEKSFDGEAQTMIII